MQVKGLECATFSAYQRYRRSIALTESLVFPKFALQALYFQKCFIFFQKPITRKIQKESKIAQTNNTNRLTNIN
jgi:hypothetical protein